MGSDEKTMEKAKEMRREKGFTLKAPSAPTATSRRRSFSKMPRSGLRLVLFVLLLLPVTWFIALLPSAAAAESVRRIHVYAAVPSSSGAAADTSSATATTNGEQQQDAAVARKQQHDLGRLATAAAAAAAGSAVVELHYSTREEQLAFLQEHCGSAAELWNSWETGAEHHWRPLQTELYKWCALSAKTAATTSGGDDGDDDDGAIIKVWIDSQSPVLASLELQKLWTAAENVAVLDRETVGSGSEPMVHGSYLQIAGENNPVPLRMLETLLRPEMQQMLPTHALLIPRQTYHWISSSSRHGGGDDDDDDDDDRNSSWTFLNLSCRNRKAKTNKHLECAKGYCCSIQSESATLLMSRHLVLPHQTLPPLHQIPGPLNAAERSPDDPFVSTIRVEPLGAASEAVPTFYDILQERRALPGDEACSKCLREKGGADCRSCAKPCAAYCRHLCRTAVPAPHCAAEWTVTLPQYSRDPGRLIPRIAHQTWFEALDAERYPNMSRMARSFQKAGWEYRFWSDGDATLFLRAHFPAPVLEAYQALKPGAFKADLFRYCVLLITGGVYADVDIQLESVLDLSIPPDVGFIVPVDEPGKPVGKQMCLWNGLIGATPGHPFLAKAIETIVNQVRNRWTSVDVDATFCPDPELSVLHAYDTLFTAGPCLLGASINRVLGRNGQTSHVPGELHGLWSGEQREMTKEGTSFVRVDDANDDMLLKHRIPGRTIILHQNKWDMGAHRFTFLEQNLVVAATDLPDSNDREHLEEGGAEHYSKAHAKVGVYGVDHLYADKERANENIRIVIDASMHAKKQAAVVTAVEQ